MASIRTVFIEKITNYLLTMNPFRQISYCWLFIFGVYGNYLYNMVFDTEINIASNVAISDSIHYVIQNDFDFNQSSVICVFLQASTSNAHQYQSYIVNDFIKNLKRIIPFKINEKSSTHYKIFYRSQSYFNVILIDTYDSFR